jgi:hypothetical protein
MNNLEQVHIVDSHDTLDARQCEDLCNARGDLTVLKNSFAQLGTHTKVPPPLSRRFWTKLETFWSSTTIILSTVHPAISVNF